MKRITVALLALAVGLGLSIPIGAADSRTHTRFTNVDVTGAMEITGGVEMSTVTVSGSQGLRLGTIVAVTSTPAAAGIIARNSSNELYISTGTGPGAWVKVGGQ